MKKKLKYIIAITLITLTIAGIAIGAIIGIPAYKTSQAYQSAEKLLQDGQYEEAKSEFWALGEYKDSVEKIKECDYQKAQKYLQDKQFDEAKELFKELGDYSDSNQQINACEYGRAEDYLTKKEYDAAQTIFEKLGKYEDSAEKIKACQYGKAEDYLRAKKLEEAKKIYKKLGKYKDAQKKLKECEYQTALQLLSDADYESAVNQLKKLKKYSDSKKYLQKAQWKMAYTEVIYNWSMVKQLCKKKGKYIGQGDDYDYMEEYFGDISYTSYALKDLDEDKVPELLLYSDNTNMTAILTYKSGLKYVGTFYNAFMNEENQIVEDKIFRGGADYSEYYLGVFSFEKGKAETVSEQYKMMDSLSDYMHSFDDMEEEYEDGEYEWTTYYYVRGKKPSGLDVIDSSDDTYKITEDSFQILYHKISGSAKWFSEICSTSLSDSETIQNY